MPTNSVEVAQQLAVSGTHPFFARLYARQASGHLSDVELDAPFSSARRVKRDADEDQHNGKHDYGD